MKVFSILTSIACLLVAGCGISNEERFLAAVGDARAGNSNVFDVREWPMADDSLLRELAGIDGLQSLNLDRTPVTDAGIAAIGRLPGLKSLSLTRTRLSGESVEMIVDQFPGLVHLRLDETTIGPGVPALARSENLQQLSLYRVPVTSPMCKELAKITTLRDLSLDQSMITDDGLGPLAKLTNLHRLSIWQCAVTDKALEKFAKSRPDVHVNR